MGNKSGKPKTVKDDSHRKPLFENSATNEGPKTLQKPVEEENTDQRHSEFGDEYRMAAACADSTTNMELMSREHDYGGPVVIKRAVFHPWMIQYLIAIGFEARMKHVHGHIDIDLHDSANNIIIMGHEQAVNNAFLEIYDIKKKAFYRTDDMQTYKFESESLESTGGKDIPRKEIRFLNENCTRKIEETLNTSISSTQNLCDDQHAVVVGKEGPDFQTISTHYQDADQQTLVTGTHGQAFLILHTVGLDTQTEVHNEEGLYFVNTPTQNLRVDTQTLVTDTEEPYTPTTHNFDDDQENTVANTSAQNLNSDTQTEIPVIEDLITTSTQTLNSDPQTEISAIQGSELDSSSLQNQHLIPQIEIPDLNVEKSEFTNNSTQNLTLDSQCEVQNEEGAAFLISSTQNLDVDGHTILADGSDISTRPNQEADSQTLVTDVVGKDANVEEESHENLTTDNYVKRRISKFRDVIKQLRKAEIKEIESSNVLANIKIDKSNGIITVEGQSKYVSEAKTELETRLEFIRLAKERDEIAEMLRKCVRWNYQALCGDERNLDEYDALTNLQMENAYMAGDRELHLVDVEGMASVVKFDEMMEYIQNDERDCVKVIRVLHNVDDLLHDVADEQPITIPRADTTEVPTAQEYRPSENQLVTDNQTDNIQSLAANSQSLAANSQSLAANSQSLAANSQSLAANSQSLAANSQSLAANSQSLAANSQSLAANNQSLAANSQSLVANNQSQAQDSMKKAKDQRNLKLEDEYVKLTVDADRALIVVLTKDEVKELESVQALVYIKIDIANGYITLDGPLRDVRNAEARIHTKLRHIHRKRRMDIELRVPNTIVKWSYEHGNDQVDYEEFVNIAIEASYRNMNDGMRFYDDKRVEYVIDFVDMLEYAELDRNDQVRVFRRVIHNYQTKTLEKKSFVK